MNIKEAIDEAMPKGRSITRISWEKEHMLLYIIPTNTISGMILTTVGKKDAGVGWQPEAQDLQATDWITRG